MGCCLIALALMAMPRGVVALLWLNGYIGRAYQTMLWPLLGFFFMPWTTAAYAICMNQWGGVKDAGVILIIVAVIMDLGSHGSTEHARRSRRSKDDDQE